MEQKRLADRDIGEKYLSSETRIITPTELDMFCSITGMRCDIFLSDDAARAVGMKSRVVPGAMSLSLLISLLGDFLEGAVWSGLTNLSFMAPVYPYDRLRAETEVLDRKVTSKGDRVFVSYSWALKNQDGTTVARGENT